MALYLRNDIASTAEELVSYSNGVVELSAIYSKSENIIIGTIYRQPDDSVHRRPSGSHELKPALAKLSRAIQSLEGTPDIIIGGDFNLPHIQWPEGSPANGCPRDEKEMAELLYDFCSEQILTQIVNKPTHYQGNILDLILTNNESLIHEYEIIPTLRSISHHSMVKVYTQYKAPIPHQNEESHPRLSPMDNLNFHSKDTDWTTLKAALNGIDWETSLEDKTPDEMLDIINRETLQASKVSVPVRDHSKKKISKQKRIRKNLTRRRKRINKQYQRITSPARKDKLHRELIQIEVKLQRMERQSMEYQEKKACDAIKNNSKYFLATPRNEERLNPQLALSSTKS